MCKEITMTKEERRIYDWIMARPQENACAVYGVYYHLAERIKNGEYGLISYVIEKALENNAFFKVEKDTQVVANICKLFDEMEKESDIL